MAKGRRKKRVVKRRKREEGLVSRLRKNFATFFNNPYASGGTDKRWRMAFYIVFVVFSLGLTIMAASAGINEDEKFHHMYEEMLINFYATGGEDRSAITVERGKMRIYGGLFDIVSGTINRALGNTSVEDPGFHKVRHVINALMGCLAIFFTGLFARLTGGWRMGLLALLFMFASPRFIGHSMMNPRDIPFAAGAVMAIYFMAVFFKQHPRVSWKTLLGLAGGIGIAIGARAGGFLLVAYFGLFLLMNSVLKSWLSGTSMDTSTLLRDTRNFALASAGGLVLALLFWPFGMVDPLNNIRLAITSFSDYSANINLLFSGMHVLAHDIRHVDYIGRWFLLTAPLFTLLGFVLFFIFFAKLVREIPFWPVFIAFFTFLFPLAYIIYKGSTLYDGLRHLLFVYPSAVLIATMGFDLLIRKFKSNKIGLILILSVTSILILEPLVFTARNAMHPYIYFNPLNGGMKGAFGNYETDYWGVSVKEAIDWMDENGIVENAENKPVKISSNFNYVTRTYARSKWGDEVDVFYTRFRERYDKDWDYAIYVGRFVDGTHLRSGNWPSSRAIYTVKANGVPISAIYQNLDKLPSRGTEALRNGDYQGALENFSREVELHPDNEIAWKGLGDAYLGLNRFDEAIEAYKKALEVNPGDMNAQLSLGSAYLRLNRVEEARNLFLNSIDSNPRNYIAYYYLGLIALNQNNLSVAMENAENAIEYNPGFRQAYILMADIYEAMGDRNRANQIRSQLN